MDQSLRVPLLELRHYELRRIPIPRTWVNKGKRKGRGSYYAPTLTALATLRLP